MSAAQSFQQRLTACLAALCLFLSAAVGAAGDSTLTPPEHRRGTEQTFLTFPEWFLVHSPAEYAAYVHDHVPTQFPFTGHIRQFWQSYRSVYDATADYPFNAGYHVMIMVIGVSTTIEYALRAAYETLIGRLSATAQTHGMSEEDRFGARVAQDYVDFIRVLPWYEFDFKERLLRLWRETSLWGPDALRKWERKYALTTEYGAKAIYGWLIKKATKAGYDAPLPVTAIVMDRLPLLPADLPDLKVLKTFDDGSALITVPRYEAFMSYATVLARQGSGFIEIAGNRSIILLSALVPRNWEPAPQLGELLFTQTILTRPAQKRVALVVPVASLAATLNNLDKPGVQLEHIYDY
ncbi:MAG TPA: hypothetical protein VGC70_14045 [Burkholderiales bacterium]